MIRIAAPMLLGGDGPLEAAADLTHQSIEKPGAGHSLHTGARRRGLGAALLRLKIEIGREQ